MTGTDTVTVRVTRDSGTYKLECDASFIVSQELAAGFTPEQAVQKALQMVLEKLDAQIICAGCGQPLREHESDHYNYNENRYSCPS